VCKQLLATLPLPLQIRFVCGNVPIIWTSLDEERSLDRQYPSLITWFVESVISPQLHLSVKPLSPPLNPWILPSLLHNHTVFRNISASSAELFSSLAIQSTPCFIPSLVYSTNITARNSCLYSVFLGWPSFPGQTKICISPLFFWQHTCPLQILKT